MKKSKTTKRIQLPIRWTTRQRWKNSAIYYGINGVIFLLSIFPFVLARWLAIMFGYIAFFVARKERQKALKQLSRAFSENTMLQNRSIIKAMFIHLSISMVENLHLRHLLKESQFATLSATQKEIFDQALARGQGVIAVSGHIGNWEILPHVVAKAGYPITSIAKSIYDPRLSYLVETFRRAFGAKIIWRKEAGAAKKMIGVLRRNEILGLLIDQDTKVQGTFVPFFDVLAHTPTAPASLALRTGATLVVASIFRQHKQHQLNFEILPFKSSGDFEKDVQQLTHDLSFWLESAIRKHPEQWVWFHERWKKKPNSI